MPENTPDAQGNITQNGVPVHATDEEAAGTPDAGRQHSENAGSPGGGNADAPKHDHQQEKGYAPKK